jgi:hypothetical protein
VAITIEDIRYLDKFRPSEIDVDYALYHVGEAYDVEIDIRVEEIVVNDAKDYENGANTIVVEPEPYITGIADRERLVWCNNPNAFANFFVGDTIVITGAQKSQSNGTFTIAEKINNGAFRISETTTIPSFLNVGGTVHISTPFRGVRYSWNFINNGLPTNFIDDTTGKLQLAVEDSADNTNVTLLDMTLVGDKDWQDGSVKIKGNGSSTYGQKFTIKHSGIIKPIHKAGQYDDTLARIEPVNTNPLKHIFQIDVNREYTNPNDTQTIVFDPRMGNTVWFNKNYNALTQNYSVTDVAITRVVDSVSLSALEVSSEADVTFRVTNNATTPFSSGNTKGMAYFWTLPSEEEFYTSSINNNRTFLQNFTYDRALATNGGAVVNGVNFGTGYQVIKELEIDHVNSSNIDVRIRINIGADAQNVINNQTEKRYLIAFTTEDHTRDRANSDKVCLLVNINDFYLQLFDGNLIDAETNLIQHPQDADFNVGLPTLDVFPTDDVVAFTQYSIDFDGLQSDGINILSVTHELVMTKTGFADIVLEQNTYSIGASTFINGYIPLIDFEQNRSFKLSDGDFRKLVTSKRNPALDSGTVVAYKNTYPFKIRFEYWEALTGVSNIDSSVYDTDEPNNGYNHFWHYYQTKGYQLNYRQTFVVIQNGISFQQVFDTPIITHPFNDNAEWGNESIKSYDVATSTELVSGGTKFLQSYVDTKLIASFEKISGTEPAIEDVNIVLWGIVKESGNIASIVQYSSYTDTNGDTWFKSIDGSNKVVKAKTGAVYTGECLTNFVSLPNNTDFTIYARLYEPPSTTPFGKQTEDGDFKTTEDNIIKTLE